ncbi:MAG: hypothetical protein ACREVW_04455 [Burkholderiales bacterium]
MKKSVWRFLLACLLLVALPFQGFAAASMLACGSNHHQMSDSLAQAAEPTASTLHDLPDEASHHHSSTHHAVDTDASSGQSSLSSNDSGSIDSTSNLNGTFKCKNCAPCSVGTALTSDVSTHVAAPMSEADFPALTIVSPLPPVGILYRPPQTLLT